MKFYRVQASEENRLDLFLERTMGGNSKNNRIYFLYFNPNLDPLNFKAGITVKVPSRSDISKISSVRYFLDNLVGI